MELEPLACEDVYKPGPMVICFQAPEMIFNELLSCMGKAAIFGNVSSNVLLLCWSLIHSL